MHGNLENKLLGLSEYAKEFIRMEVDFVSFDFSGCGNSDGEFVSLGWKERDDLDCILEYLKKEQRTSKVVLWGGGQGAVTALMYEKQPLPIAALVLESPYTDVKSCSK